MNDLEPVKYHGWNDPATHPASCKCPYRNQDQDGRVGVFQVGDHGSFGFFPCQVVFEPGYGKGDDRHQQQCELGRTGRNFIPEQADTSKNDYYK